MAKPPTFSQGLQFAHEAKVAWDTRTPTTAVNTMTTTNALVYAQAVEYDVKALRCLDGQDAGRHGLADMWDALPLEDSFKERFRPLVTLAGQLRPQVAYPGSDAYRVLTEEMPFAGWVAYERQLGELTSFVIRVADHEEHGTPQPSEWRPPVRRRP